MGNIHIAAGENEGLKKKTKEPICNEAKKKYWIRNYKKEAAQTKETFSNQ